MADETNQQKHTGGPTRAQPPGGSRGERRDSGSEPCGACPDNAPASFEKRTAAWMGVAYMLMLLFILNFTLFTGGRQLPGTFPLFLAPVSVALAVVMVLWFVMLRKGDEKLPVWLPVATLVVAVAMVVEPGASGSTLASMSADVLNYYFSSQETREEIPEENTLIR